MLAHVRNNTIIQTYNGSSGWVELEDGNKVTPPVAGYVNGNDKILEVQYSTADTSTSTETVLTTTMEITANTVIQKTTIRDKNADELKVGIDEERDRRLANGTLAFANTTFDFNDVSVKRINGAGTLALGAIVNGAQVGDYRWSDPNTDFVWIASDNSLVQMDAQTMFAFGQAAAEWESKHIFAARVLKDMNPIPLDYKNDAYWPS